MSRSEADHPEAVSPWQPERRPLYLAALGKLAEELGELQAIVGRCLIQGIDEVEPETGVLNRAALEKELADVQAAGMMVEGVCDLNVNTISRRVVAKVAHLKRWHRLLEANRDGSQTDGR